MKSRRHRAIAKARIALHLHEFNLAEQQLLNAGFVKKGVLAGRFSCQSVPERNWKEERMVMGVDWGRKGEDNSVITRTTVGSRSNYIIVEDVSVYE